MSIKKLENSSDHAMVAEEVKILTNLLNESTRQLSGDVIFNKIQDLINTRKNASVSEMPLKSKLLVLLIKK